MAASERKQEECHLLHLVNMIQLTTRKTKLQFDELVAMISDAACNAKFLPHHKFQQKVPQVKSQFQKLLDIHKSIQLMLREYIKSCTFDLCDLESICKSDEGSLAKWQKFENRVETPGELNRTSQDLELKIRERDAETHCCQLVPFNNENSVIHSLPKESSVQTTANQVDDSHLTSSTFIESQNKSNEIVPLGALPCVILPSPQVPLNGAPEAAMISHVNSPNHFYLHLVNSETASLDWFCETMMEIYKDDDEQLNVLELPVASCWAARWTDGMWYRAFILANIFSEATESSQEKDPQVRVSFVDYGDEGIVSTKDIRVLHEDLTLLPSLAVPCCLAQVYPVDGWQGHLWSTESIKVFLELCGGYSSVLFASFQEYSLSGTYNILLTRPDGVVVNDEFIARGFAIPKFSPQVSDHDESQYRSQGLEEIKHDEEEIPDGWDPMSSVYFSPENSVLHNDECAETVILGRRNNDEARLCKFFCKGRKCPRGETCRLEHTRIRRDGITVEKEEVHQEYLELHPLVQENSLLAVIVTSVITPCHFYVHLPFGTQCLQEASFVDKSAMEMELLMSAMQKYYKKAHPQSQECLLAPGELKALCEQKNGKVHCSRVRVIGIKEDKYSSLVQVFSIDFGYTNWVPENQLHPLAVQFIHTPSQAVDCWLTGVESPRDGWHPSAGSYLTQLTEGRTLVAHVNHIDRDHQRLGVTLHNTDEGHDININEFILKKLKK